MNEEFTEEDFFKMMECIARDDIKGLVKAQESYGDSWKKRGGIGAYMMMVRKTDRIELQTKKHGYDIFKAIESDPRSEAIIDDLRDLRRYLFLIETLMAMRGVIKIGDHRDNKVDELNDINDKEALLRFAEPSVYKIIHQPPSSKDIEVRLYIPFKKQPPEWGTVLEKIGNRWLFSEFPIPKGQDLTTVTHWPSYQSCDYPLECYVAVDEFYVEQGVNYRITRIIGPSSYSLKGQVGWAWEVKATPLT